MFCSQGGNLPISMQFQRHSHRACLHNKEELKIPNPPSTFFKNNLVACPNAVPNLVVFWDARPQPRLPCDAWKSPLNSALCALQGRDPSMRRRTNENTFQSALLTCCPVITTIYDLPKACFASPFGRRAQHPRPAESWGKERRLCQTLARLKSHPTILIPPLS